MRAFTLVEVLTSLSIGLVLLSATVKLGMDLTGKANRDRGRLAVRNNLSLADRELSHFVRGLEPDFMNINALADSPVHGNSHIHGSLAYTEHCPDSEEGACLTVFDLRPLDEDPHIYGIEDAAWPHSLSIAPVDANQAPGPGENILEQSVLLFYGEGNTFCALVDRVLGNRVLLARGDSQLWLLPEQLDHGNYRIVHLGYLEVTHCFLAPEPDWGRKMVYQPWYLERNRWKPNRSRSSHGLLHSMEWTRCSETEPDRLILTGQARNAPQLTRPILLAGRRFDREVFCVSWEF